jgi:large-conductance mechanosensitive channel
MNFSPGNVTFGNPNENPTSFMEKTETPEKKETKESDSNETTSTQNKINTIYKFLNTKASTILTFAIAIAIGYAIKDFMNAFVMYVFQPSMMLLIMAIDRNNYLPLTEGLREKNIAIDLPKFLGNMLILKLVIGSMYLVNKYSDVLF